MALSPMMQQYLNLKEQYKDSLLFFRLGDFYEMFFEDAQTASRELELTLTGRDCGLSERAPMCGVPYHSVDQYISRLLEKGYKVAICEQLTEPTKGKSIVERDVVRIITPGTVIEESLLDEKTNNYICAIYKAGGNVGISYCDVSTGEFAAIKISDGIYTKTVDEIVRIKPSEILVNNEMLMYLGENSDIMKIMNVKPYPLGDDSFDYAASKQAIKSKFPETGEENELLVCSAGALLSYLKQTQKNALEHINTFRTVSHGSFVKIDAATGRNLEITSTMRGGTKRGSLLWLLDKTITSMGARKLKKWLDEPLFFGGWHKKKAGCGGRDKGEPHPSPADS